MCGGYPSMFVVRFRQIRRHFVGATRAAISGPLYVRVGNRHRVCVRVCAHNEASGVR